MLKLCEEIIQSKLIHNSAGARLATREKVSRLVELWNQMPPKVRTDLRYPHLKTMLATDPTEAVLFELIVATLKKYFDVVEARTPGGAVAYQLLWNNKKLFHVRNAPDSRDWIDKIIEADIRYTDGKVENSLLAFLLCSPKKGALDDKQQLIEWTREELQREHRMQAYGGRYYPKTALEIIYK